MFGGKTLRQLIECSMNTALRPLRPCLRPRCRPPPFVGAALHPRFYCPINPQKVEQDHIIAVQEHRDELESSRKSVYPRIVSSESSISCREFATAYEYLRRGQFADSAYHTIHGRILSIRTVSSKLVFIDIVQNRRPVQAVCEFRKLVDKDVTEQYFKDYCKTLVKGDIISLRGRPYRTRPGELSISLLELPQLLSSCLHPIPTGLQDKQTRIRNRHVDFLVNTQMADNMRLRSKIINYIRHFLMSSHHTEVQTPVLADRAGGAVARPFQTSSLEFPDRQITLRVAPELWLKRLVLGGFDRIFEIGPSFRNEGIDLTHNPEFTTCEFYTAYADLEELIKTTEKLISGLSHLTTSLIQKKYRSLTPQVVIPSPPFPRLDFIRALESALYTRLPDLESPGAADRLEQICQDRDIPVPSPKSLPRLLNKLSALYLEPQCSAPTFIINHPECLSPLSKSFPHPTTNQRVAARAELFINHQEIANTYEEENSPVEQRRKFVQQLRYRGEDASAIDEDYLQALEWGLPPTGGWGCGIERLCMVLSGAGRIGDVLPFGTLRNVVSLGHSSSKDSKPAVVDSEPAAC